MRAPLLAACAAALLSACLPRYTTLDPARPVDVRQGWGGTVKQDGKLVADLADRLKEHPASSGAMEGFDAKAYGAMALQAAGAGLVLFGTWNNLRIAEHRSIDPLSKDSTSWGLTALGAVLYLGSLPLAVSANNQLANAAEAYNASFAPRPAATPVMPLPFLATVEDAAGRRQCVGGFQLGF
jgi:hypothetical protein